MQDTYRLTLDGFHEENGIHLTARVENLTGAGKAVTISGFDENPHKGDFFGYRHISAPWFDVNQLEELVFRHDNFAVLVTHEPLSDVPLALAEILELVQISFGESGVRLAITATKPEEAEDLAWSVEVSSDLIDWTPGETVSDTDMEFTGRDTVDISAAERRFIRLRLDRP